MATHVDRVVTTVLLWQNGMVMVFDQFGSQMCELQGRVDDVRDKINTVFKGEWQVCNWYDIKPNQDFGSVVTRPFINTDFE